MANFNALNIPPPAIEKGGHELMRAAVANDGELYMSIRRGFDDPEGWGRVLAEVVKHVSQIYATEGQFPEEQTLERIRALFNAEMDSPTDPGTTSAVS